MVKIQPNFHQGLEFIQLSQLPPEEASRLNRWLPSNGTFKVVLEDVVLEECITYDHYQCWFDWINFDKQMVMTL